MTVKMQEKKTERSQREKLFTYRGIKVRILIPFQNLCKDDECSEIFKVLKKNPRILCPPPNYPSKVKEE